MSICIYRHKKLYAVIPRAVSNVFDKDGYISHNFAHVKNDVCKVRVSVACKDTEDYLQCCSISVEQSAVGNPTHRSFNWSLSAMDQMYVRTEDKIGNTTVSNDSRPGDLVNLMWSFKHRREVLLDMIETMCSRSVIELLMHETEVDAECYDILQMYFTDDHQFVINRLPIRSYDEAIKASEEDKSESPDEWLKLFESA